MRTEHQDPGCQALAFIAAQCLSGQIGREYEIDVAKRATRAKRIASLQIQSNGDPWGLTAYQIKMMRLFIHHGRSKTQAAKASGLQANSINSAVTAAVRRMGCTSREKGCETFLAWEKAKKGGQR